MAGADELTLLERVFLRIGSAETDDQLETTLGKFLAPVLLKLSSADEAVRKKVMELLIHVNKRLKSRPKVKLPVDSLLLQYQDPASSPFVTNFSILYVKMGYPRMEMDKQAEMAPILISCLENKPKIQQDGLLQLLTSVLGHIKLPDDPVQRKDKFSFSDRPQTTKLLLEFLMDVLLLPYSAPPAAKPTTEPIPGRPATAPPGSSTAATASPSVSVPAGMSEAGYKRAVGESPLSPENLEKAKLGIVQFLSADLLPEQDIVCHYVVAAADNRHSVATSADLELKRITGSTNWNDPAVVTKLYDLFLGTILLKGQGQKMTKAEMRTCVSTRVKLKIFPYLLKSRQAANTFPQGLQVIFDCMYGTNTTAKLKNLAVQFVHHLCWHCEDENLGAIGQVLLSGMLNLIRDNKDDAKLRNLAYVAVGKIGKRLPSLVSNDVGLAQKFFDAICKEESETRLGVQEALSILAVAFRTMDNTNKRLMEALISQNIEKEEPQARMMAVQYAKAVFPPDHVASRYLLLLACGDSKEDIYAEASKALRSLPTSEERRAIDGLVDSAHLPRFDDMVQFINGKAQLRLASQQKFVIGNHTLPFNPVTFGEMLMYLRMCLANDAGVTPNLESVTSMQGEAPAIAKHVTRLLTSQPGKAGPIQLYIDLILQLLRSIGGPPAMYCLLEIVAVAPAHLAPQFLEQLDFFKSFIFSSKDDMRDYAAQLYAIVIVCAKSENDVTEAIEEFITNITDKSLERQHGSMLGLGYLVGQQVRRRSGGMVVEDMEDEKSVLKYKQSVVAAIHKMAKLAKDQNALLMSGACTALSEIGRTGPLPLPPAGEKQKAGEVTKFSIVSDLLNIVKSGKEDNKNKERAALCLGYICVGEKDFPHHRLIIEGLMDAIQTKQIELHFSIGEALVYAAQGDSSPASRNLWLQTEHDFKSGRDSQGDVEWYLNVLLTKYVTNNNPFIRQAACIWLLSLVKKCASYTSVQTRVADIQGAFMKLLSENEEVIQDIASKGLGLVYENCTAEQKQTLVQELVNTLTTGKKSGLSTYKELCSIANDLNQPDLIYKFMHLANHNAMWNSRKGAAFGFSTIAAQAGEQLAPYLSQIVPKLYRYQFDPNPKIQMAMSSIWNALVKDNKQTVDTFLKEILKDLIKNLTSTQWRVRESSCAAVNDLLRGRQLEEVVEQLPNLWESCLRVRDDIKESVRLSAEIACRTLSRASVKICDVNNGKIGEKAINLVLPCLLKNSLESRVDEVRALGLSTILKISKNAGMLLKPHIPVLVVALLEAVSGLEPQMMNYLSLHAGSSQAAQDKIDSVRIAASKMSPMMETVNLCVQYVDETVLKELVPRLSDLIKAGIGVGTKAGCSSFIVSLVHQCPQDLVPFTGKLMGALLNGLHDRNTSVRKSYATAIGHLAKISKDSSVEKLITRLKSWYLVKEDETARHACGVTLHAISRHSPDVLKRHGALAMPLAFFAMHEKKNEEPGGTANTEDEESEWKEVWLETTPGTEGGIRLYLGEIVSILKIALEARSWPTKAQAAAAMSTVADKLGSSLGPPHLGDLLNALIGGLAGRTWTGKEALLQAISSVCTSCKHSLVGEDIPEGQPSLDQVIEAVLKECRKDNAGHKLEAVQCWGAILEAHGLDRFTDTWDTLIPHLHQKDEEKEDKEEKGDRKKLEMDLKFEETGYEVLGQAWPTCPNTQELYRKRMAELLSSRLPISLWKVQVSILKTMQKFVKRLLLLESVTQLSEDPGPAEGIINTLLTSVIPCLGNLRYAVIRKEALSVIDAVILKLEGVKHLDVLRVCREELLTGLSGLSKDNKSVLQDKAKDLERRITETDMDQS